LLIDKWYIHFPIRERERTTMMTTKPTSRTSVNEGHFIKYTIRCFSIHLIRYHTINSNWDLSGCKQCEITMLQNIYIYVESQSTKYSWYYSLVNLYISVGKVAYSCWVVPKTRALHKMAMEYGSCFMGKATLVISIES
jgi:hypothetical protein